MDIISSHGIILSFVALFAIVFGIISYRNIRWAVYICILFLPAYVLRFHIGPLPSTILEVMILVVCGMYVSQNIPRLNKISLRTLISRIQQGRNAWFLLAVVLFFIASIIGIFISVVPLKALGVWRAYFFEPFAFACIFFSVIKTPRHLRRAFFALGVSAAWVSCIAVIQYITGIGLIPPWDGITESIRATSVYDFPNAIGLYVAPISVLFVGLLLQNLPLNHTYKHSQQRLYVMFSILVIGCSFLGMLVSHSRGALVAFFIASIILGFARQTRKWFLLLILALLFVAFLFPSVRDAFSSIRNLQDVSTDVRLVLWQGTLRMIKAHPLFGVGISSFPLVYEQFKEAKHVEFLQYPHNIVLNFWVEIGLLGVGSFFWIVGETLYRAYQNRKNSIQTIKTRAHSFLISVNSGLVGGMIALLVHGLVDVPYFKNDLSIMFWVFIVGFFSIDKLQNVDREAKKVYNKSRNKGLLKVSGVAK